MRDSLGPLVRHLQDPEYDLGKSKLQRPSADVQDTMYGHLDPEATPAVKYMAQVFDAATQNGSMRLMKMNDWMVRSSIGMSRAKAMAYRVAVNEGLEGKAIIKRVEELINTMPDEMYDDMIRAGDVATLTQELTTPSKAILKAVNSIPILRFILPFMKTALAGVELNIERLPLLAMSMPEVQKAWAKGGAAKADVLAKQATGTALIASGIYAYSSGEAHSGVTLNKTQRASFNRLGVPEFSVVDSKGNYKSWNFASPVHELYMVGVSIGEIIDNAREGIPPTDPRYKSWDEVMLELAQMSAWSFADIYVNKSIGRSIREFMDAIDNPETKSKSKTINLMTQLLVPVAGMDHAVKAVDPLYRRVPAGTFYTQMIDQFKKRVPWLSMDLPAQTGFFGEKLKYGGFMAGMLRYRKGTKYYAVAEEMMANNVAATMPNRHMTIAGVDVDLDIELNPNVFSKDELEDNPELTKRGYAYERFREIRGSVYADGPMGDGLGSLNDFIHSDAYTGNDLDYGPPGDEQDELTKGDLIKRHMMFLNGIAKNMFVDEMNDKMDIFRVVDEIRSRKSEAGEKAMVAPGIAKQRAANEVTF